MRTYSVLLVGKKIGTADVEKRGLYYKIRCVCYLDGREPVHIIVSAEREVDLGLCVPNGKHYELNTSIPVKQVGEGELTFQAASKCRPLEMAVPVTADEPFQYIMRLKDAYCVRRKNQIYIGFKNLNLSSNLQDNDQNP